MQLSTKCLQLLQNSNINMLKSNILIADTKSILFVIIDKKSNPLLDYKYYYNKSLSQDMLDLENMWRNKESSENLFLIVNDNLKQIISNDTTHYSAQMFFPLFMNNKLDGFAIFFRIYGDYISSSFKAPKTLRNFIQKELDNANNS